jgi:hypothetical protein
MDYDLGDIDLEQRTLQLLDNPFGPKFGAWGLTAKARAEPQWPRHG